MPADRDMVNAGIGRRVRSVRTNHPRLTQAELAKALGVTAGAVGNWERGAGVDRAHLVALANLRGVDLEWLMTGKGSPSGGPGEPPAPLHVENIETVTAMFFEALGVPEDQSRVLASVVIEVAGTLSPDSPTQAVRDQARIAISTALRFLAPR